MAPETVSLRFPRRAASAVTVSSRCASHTFTRRRNWDCFWETIRCSLSQQLLTERTHVNSKVEKKNTIAGRFKEVRKLLGLTQAKLAEQLDLSRNYVAKIEAGIQEPSTRTANALESLRVAFENTQSTKGVDHALSDRPQTEYRKFGKANEVEVPDQASYGSSKSLAAEARRHLEELLVAAQHDPRRIGWIIEQMREHLALPRNWKQPVLNDPVRVILPSQTAPLANPSQRSQSA